MAVSAKFERMVQRAVGPRLDALDRDIAHVRAIAASALDGIPDLRRQLLAARSTDEYSHALSDPNPLVTVRIPTYRRSKLLVERALPSIVRQTHQNFEVIVVGDGCTNDTAERIPAFGDPRVRREPSLPISVPRGPGATLARRRSARSERGCRAGEGELARIAE